MIVPLGILAGGKRIPDSGLVSNVVVGGNGPSYTSGGQYIGKPHPKRVVVVAVATGDTTASPINAVYLDGVACALGARASGSGSMRCCAVYYMHKPAGTVANIQVNANNNAAGCLVSVYAIYPSSPGAIDSGSGITTATSCSITGLVAVNKGFFVGVSHHRNTNGTGWGGTLGLPFAVGYNGTVGGVNASSAFAVTPQASGTVVASWAGSNNGSVAGALWAA